MHPKQLERVQNFYQSKTNGACGREQDLARNVQHYTNHKIGPQQNGIKAVSTKFIGALESLFFW
jgi:hypothetical protein